MYNFQSVCSKHVWSKGAPCFKMSYAIGIKIILWSFKVCVEIVYLPVHVVRLFKKQKKCSPIGDELLLLPARELAARIRKQQTSSVCAVQTYIARINEVNPLINAMMEGRFDLALQEAKTADEIVRNSDLSENEIEEQYPLLGVPITIKGSIAVEGMVHSSGRVDHQVRASQDGDTVKYVRQAGAIILLTSNVPELCLNWETKNKLIGTTRNPYDITRTAGGSSGGEASLMGAGASVIGIGSDIAGSLRIPAHYCGVWGHKPSPFAVSCVGHYPDCKNRDEWNRAFTLGPMARFAVDLKPLLQIIVEPQYRPILRLTETVDVKKIKVYYMEDAKSSLANRVSGSVVEALAGVVNHLDTVCEDKCTKSVPPLMKYCMELSYLRLLHLDDVDNLFEGKGKGAYSELLRFIECRSKHEFTSISYGVLRRNLRYIPEKSMDKVYKVLDDLRNDFIKFLGTDSVFLLPTSPSEATYHNDIIRRLFNMGYVAIFNALGFPVTNCPVGFSKNGLPIGIQVVAAPNMDRLSLTVAEELERGLGGWKFN